MWNQLSSRQGWRRRIGVGAMALTLSVVGGTSPLSRSSAQQPVPAAPAELPERAPAPAPVAAPPATPNEPVPEGNDLVYPIDLPTALKLVNENNPVIAIARERIQQAYYFQREAKFLWLPNLQIVPGVYTRHDGQIQDVIHGLIETSSWGDHFTGGGAVMNYSTSDTLFLPLIRRRLLTAEQDSARATTNDVQLRVALAYLDLLSIYGQMAIKDNTLARALEMQRNAESAAEAGKSSTSSDVQRARTEVETRRQERILLEAQAAEFSAQLAQFLLLQPTIDLRPAEPAIVPIVLVSDGIPLDELVAVGLINRPELAQNRALVEAALLSWKQARTRPLLPSIQLQYYSGVFGGGPGGSLDNWSGRGDGTALAVWQLTNLGAGDIAKAREQKSIYNQSTLHVVEVQAQVAAQVTASAKAARVRLKTLAAAQEGVRQALEMWRRLQESTFGMANPTGKYDPIGPLLAEQAIDQARNLYLTEVIEYNKAQFRLYTALGQPSLEALCQATPIGLDVSVIPPIAAPGEPKPLIIPKLEEKK